jgi:uncharacterized protein (DUF2141 family)
MTGLAVLALLVGSLAPAFAAAANVEITISGLQPGGRLLGKVFDSADSFKARDKSVLSFAFDPAGAKTARTTIALPPGKYAIALFQDTKGTGKLETNFLGKPKVPYGFSNNARGSFGPPSFDAAVFTVGADATALTIQLQ